MATPKQKSPSSPETRPRSRATKEVRSFPRPLLPLGLDVDAPALLGISGGRDSVVLLHVLLELGFNQLILCHLDHGLRGEESEQDAAFVERLAKKHGLKCEVEHVDVAAQAQEKRLSTETAAREARHAFYLRMAEKHDTWMVFLAHHAEDQAETILGNVCRGSSVSGLRGMRPVQSLDSGLHLLRPLLSWRRADIDTWLKQNKLRFREDSSNASAEFRRNRLRHEALPLLSDICGRDVIPLLNRLGALADRDDDCLRMQAEAHLLAEGSLVQAAEKRAVAGPALAVTPELLALHPAVQSRVLATWLRTILLLPGIESDVLEQAQEMLAVGGPAKINLPQGRHLRRKAKRLWVEEG